MKPQIPWLRVFVEGVVIVGSILLALGIEGALEERSERSQEAALIERLLDEFRNNRGILEEVISENHQFNKRALELGLMGPEALRTLRDDSVRTLGGLGAWHIFTAGGMYEAITRDGLVGENEGSRQRSVLVDLLGEGPLQQNLFSHRLFRGRYIEVLESAMAQLDALLALLESELAI